MGAGQSNAAGASKEAVFYPESGKGTVQVRLVTARPVPALLAPVVSLLRPESVSLAG
jgi:hypothetical protein